MKGLMKTFAAACLLLIIAGNADARKFEVYGPQGGIVPMSCSERFVETYGERAELIVVEGENHMITRNKKDVVALAVSFFKELK